MIRLFVALLIPENITEKLADICKNLVPDYSLYGWEAKEKIHLTLKFIGEVNEELVPSISNELEFVKNFHSFNFYVSGFGFFYRNNYPAILWAGLKTDDSIYTLVEGLNNRMQLFNIQSEKRKFKSHLTLLRIKRKFDQNLIENFTNYKFENLKFNANKIALIKSELSPKGANYTNIENYKLN